MRKLTPRVGAGVTVLLLEVFVLCAPIAAAGGRIAPAGMLAGSVLAVLCLTMPRPWSAPPHGLLLSRARHGSALDTTTCHPAIPSATLAGVLRQGCVLPAEIQLC